MPSKGKMPSPTWLLTCVCTMIFVFCFALTAWLIVSTTAKALL